MLRYYPDSEESSGEKTEDDVDTGFMWAYRVEENPAGA